MNAGIVGGGIVGLSAARILAERGHSVTLYERFPLFHDRGSSHGRTRIVRRAYPDAFYTACMAEAYPMWAELEAKTGRKLVDECGLLYFGSRDATNVVSMVAGLESVGVPFQILGPAETRRLIPTVQMEPNEVAVFTPEAGWVDAEAARRASYDLAVARGAKIVQETVTSLARVEASHDAVIVAAGPWVRDFVSIDAHVTMQTYGYVQAEVVGPVWIDDLSLTYGFPSDEWGQKVGAHLPGPPIDPNEPNRVPDAEQLRQIAEVAQRRFGIAEPRIERVKTCLYTTTPSEDFRIGWLSSKSVFASACSGHGFKMGPWTGRILADIVEGKGKPESHPRFLWPRPSG